MRRGRGRLGEPAHGKQDHAMLLQGCIVYRLRHQAVSCAACTASKQKEEQEGRNTRRGKRGKAEASKKAAQSKRPDVPARMMPLLAPAGAWARRVLPAAGAGAGGLASVPTRPYAQETALAAGVCRSAL